MSVQFRETLRPRRVLTSLAIGLALWFALGPLTGIAMARDDSGVTWPTAWNVADRLPGDAGSYRWNEPGEDPGREFDFEWVGPKTTLVSTGRLGTVLEVRIRPAGESADPFVYAHRIFRADEAGNVISTGPEARDETLASCPDIGVACTTHWKTIDRSYHHQPDEVSKIPCGLVHNLQLASVDLHETIDFSLPCDGHQSPLAASVENVTKDAQGRVLVRLMLHRASAAPTLSVLLRADMPYPLEIDPDAATPGPVLSLTMFRRGTSADAMTVPPLVADPGPFDVVPRGRWGPSEENLQHAYSLSRAIEDASRWEPRVALYLLQHPRAYAARSDYVMAFTDPAVQRNYTWEVTLSDGRSNFDFTITRSTGLKADETVVDVTPASAERYPHPTQLPDRMPTASHLLRRWAAYAGHWGATSLDFTGYGSEFAGGDPPAGWGLLATCLDATCTDVEIRYQACQHYDITRIMLDPGTEKFRSDTLSMTCKTIFDENGTPLESYEQYTQQAVIRGVPPTRPHVPQGKMAPVILDAENAAAVGLFIGAGLASAFAAGLYWLWPTIRSLFGITLFSRIQRPQVLDNRIRADLFAVIEAEPGIHVRELRRRLNRAHGTIIHHLRMLANNKLIVARPANGRTCYFPAATSDPRRDHILVTSDRRVALLRLVAERPNATLSELAHALGLRRQTVHESTKRMRRDGLIAIAEEGRTRNVTVTDLGRTLLRARASAQGSA